MKKNKIAVAATMVLVLNIMGILPTTSIAHAASDTTPPTPSIGLPDSDGDGFYDGADFDCSDGGSGCAELDYTVNGGPVQTFTCSGSSFCQHRVLILPPPQPATVTLFVKDVAGNQSNTISVFGGIKVDPCPSDKTNTCNVPSLTANFIDGDNDGAPEAVTFTCTAGTGSQGGCKTISYSIDGTVQPVFDCTSQPASCTTQNIALPTDPGTHTVTATATSNSGDTSAKFSKTVGADVPPTTSAKSADSDGDGPIDSFILTCTPNPQATNAPCDHITYSLNGGGQSTFTCPATGVCTTTVPVPAGDFSVTFFSVDKSSINNTESPQTFSGTANDVPPTTSAQSADSDGDGLIDSVILTCTPDPLATNAPCSKITFAVNGGDQQVFTCPATGVCTTTVPVPAGDFSVTFFSVDKSSINNTESPQTFSDSATDFCPGVKGKYSGCPYQDKNHVDIVHAIFQKGGVTKQFAQQTCPNGASSCKLAFPDTEVIVFDRNKLNGLTITKRDGSMVTLTKNPDSSLYPDIFESGVARQKAMIGSCKTDNNGDCSVGDPYLGDFLVIVRGLNIPMLITGDLGFVYAGQNKGASDFVDTDKDGVVDTATKYFQFLLTINCPSGATDITQCSLQYQGGGSKTVTGSALTIIYPTDAVWSADAMDFLYPFYLQSDSDWSVDVCSQVPTGYAVAGDYDASGTFVANTSCTQTGVANEIKTIAFDVAKTGSPKEFDVIGKFKVKGPHGKVEQFDIPVHSRIKEKSKKDRGSPLAALLGTLVMASLVVVPSVINGKRGRGMK